MNKKWPIVLGVCLGACLLAAVGLVAFFRSLPKDIPPFDDSALRRPVESLPDEQNAFTHYSAAAEALQDPEDDDLFGRILAGEEWDADFVRSLLDSNAECLEHVRRGNELERCLAPRIETFDAPRPHLAQWREFARLFALKAEYHQRKGQPEESLAALFDQLRFASLVEADAGTLMDYAIGAGTRHQALARARALARSGILDDRQRLRAYGSGLVFIVAASLFLWAVTARF